MKAQLLHLPLLGAIAFAMPACQETQGPKPGAGDTSTLNPTATSTSTYPSATNNHTTSHATPSSSGLGQTSNVTPSSSSAMASTTFPTTSGPTNTSPGSTGTGSTAPSQEVPAPYAGMKNPIPLSDSGELIAGGLRYKKNCGCHDPKSTKRLPEAPELGRPPASELADDWLMWKISEGVSPKMAPFKDTFSEKERWQIIAYLRALAAKNSKG